MANLIVLVSHFDGRSQIPTEYLTYKAFHDLQDLEIWRTTYLPSAHMNSQASTHINILTDVHSHAYTNIVKWSPYTFFNTQLNYCPTCESFSGQYTTTTEISTPSFVSSLYVLHNNYIATPIIIYYTHLFTSLSRFTKL